MMYVSMGLFKNKIFKMQSFLYLISKKFNMIIIKMKSNIFN